MSKKEKCCGCPEKQDLCRGECMCHHSLQKESEWELKFQEKIKENKFVTPSSHLDVEEIKSFIQETLSNREKEIAEEVERMKVYLPQAHPDWSENYGRNDTINKVLQILKH